MGGKKPNNKETLPSEPRKGKTTNGAANRRKGHNAERLIVKQLREMGWERAATSRYASRILDDSKVDIYGVPFNIQSKCVKSTINYVQLTQEIKEAIAKNIPERLHLPILIFHKKPDADLVVMERLELFKLFNLVEKWKD